MSRSINPFLADPTSVSLPAGHPERPRSKDVDAILEEHPGLRRVFEKSSKARTMMGENEERWPQEAYEELIRQHPWITKFTVHKKMTASNSDGYGVGFFQLTPSEIPESVAGPSTINVLTLPVIIRDFELYPFDVFAYKGSFYPLNEERITRTLRLRDMFTESDRADFRSALKKNDLPLTARDLDTTSAYDHLPNVKFASIQRPVELVQMAQHLVAKGLGKDDSAKISELRDQVVDLDVVRKSGPSWNRLVRELERHMVHAPDSSSLDKTSSDPREGVLQEYASACAIELSSDGSVIRGRPIWRSSPVDGKAGPGSWSDLTAMKVSQQFGNDVLEDLLNKGWHVRNLNPSHPYERDTFERMVLDDVVKASYARVKESTLKDDGISAGFGGSSIRAELFTFLNPDGNHGLPEKFSGFVVNYLDASKLDEDFQKCSSRLGVLTDSGALVELPNVTEGMTVVSSGVAAKVPPISSFKGSGSVAVWQQDGYLLSTRFDPSSVHSIKGEDIHVSGNAGVKLSSGFRRLVKEQYGDISLLHVPDGATVIRNGNVQVGSDLSALDAVEIPKTSASRTHREVAPPSGCTPKWVKVSQSKRGILVYDPSVGTVEEEVPGLSAAQAETKLAMYGASSAMVDALLKTSAANGSVTVKLFTPALDEGAAVLAKVEKTVNQKLSSAEKFLSSIPKQELLKTAFLVSDKQSRVKRSSEAALSSSVDAALSLGFLHRDNLLKFVDLLPAMEKCLSHVCALLIAARLGLDEVPEEACEGAVRALEPILRGLRVIEYSLL